MVEPLKSQGQTSWEKGWNINKPVDEVKDPNELRWMGLQLESGGQAHNKEVALHIGRINKRLRDLLEKK